MYNTFFLGVNILPRIKEQEFYLYFYVWFSFRDVYHGIGALVTPTFLVNTGSEVKLGKLKGTENS